MVFSKQLERKSNLGENQLWLGDCFDYVVELLGLQGFGVVGPLGWRKDLAVPGAGNVLEDAEMGRAEDHKGRALVVGGGSRRLRPSGG